MVFYKRNLLNAELEKIFTQNGKEIEGSVKKLWNLFNKSRKMSQPLPTYMEDPALLNAYMAAFLLPNIERMKSVMSVPNVNRALKALILTLKRKKELKVLDYGAGPLSASFALLEVLTKLEFPLNHLCLHAIDTSENAINWGLELMAKAFTGGQQYPDISVGHHYKDTNDSYHIILMSNVINEIKAEERLGIMEYLSQRLEPNGLLIVLEPGQDKHSWALSELRNVFLESNGKDYAVIAPCPHQKRCPLSPGTGRNDWCWFRTPMGRPRWLAQLDRATGLHHDELTYSYNVFQKSLRSVAINPLKSKSRVVSDAIAIKDKSAFKYALHSKDHTFRKGSYKEFAEGQLCKTLICSNLGQLVGVYFSLSNAPHFVTRGCEVGPSDLDEQVLIMAPERVENPGRSGAGSHRREEMGLKRPSKGPSSSKPGRSSRGTGRR